MPTAAYMAAGPTGVLAAPVGMLIVVGAITRVGLLGLLAVAVGCAGAGAGGPGSAGLGQGEDDTTTTSGGEEGPGDESDEGKTDDPMSPPDLGPCSNDSDCTLPEGTCYASQGFCQGGACVNPNRPAGEPCDDGDPCTSTDVCDGSGTCRGSTMGCDFENTVGGTCNAGICEGATCVEGFGDCDNDLQNGCETPLNSATDCGECGSPCADGPNATADCSTGTCELSCDDPYEDCDGDPSNGCEIPTGIPNQCDANGLNPDNGCWTAHCGTSTNADAVNFDTWFCFECTTCNSPGAGQCRWCSHDTGTWFPAEDCACGAFEDLVCSP